MKRAVAVTAALLGVWSLIVVMGRYRKPATQYGPPQSEVTAEQPGDTVFKKAALGEAEVTIAGWPQRPQQVARRMLDKYGPPDELTTRRVVWNDNGPWKRTIVARDGSNAPLEQVAAYRMPNEGYEALGRLEGKVSAERGRDELSARSDSEALNFLSLNLADEVVSGKRAIDDARRAYRDNAALLVSGKDVSYSQRLLFVEPASASTPAKTKQPKDRKGRVMP